MVWVLTPLAGRHARFMELSEAVAASARDGLIVEHTLVFVLLCAMVLYLGRIVWGMCTWVC